MPAIPEYTTSIVRRRATPNTVNMQAIDDAGATMRGVSKATAMGAEMAQKYKDADDATALNDAIIAKQKSDLEWIDAQRKTREGNPDKFAKDIEPEIKKRDDEFMKNLSGAAKRQFKPTAARINLQTFESNLNWENTRKTQIYASRIQNSKDNLSILAYRAGQEGKPLDDILNNADATVVAGSGVFAPEQLSNLRQDVRKAVIMNNLQGLMESDPAKAKEIIKSRKYDSDLGPDGVMRLTENAEAAEKQKKYDMLAAQEADAVTLIANQNQLMDEIQQETINIDEKVLKINQMELNGQIDGDFATKSRRYLSSLEKIDSVTDSQKMSEILTRVYDMNSISEVSQKDYLLGIQNIKEDIMVSRAMGDLSAQDETKLFNQIKTLTSAKISDATQQASYSFGAARGIINNSLPPELRGEATRRMFYEAQKLDEQKFSKEEKELAYKNSAQKIVDEYNTKRRQTTLETIKEAYGPPKDNKEIESILEAKGYTMRDVQETAKKYGITEQQVINKLRSSGG